ncbi:MAG TPA: ABC transporter permease [Streptosporangiaceae bacterium]|nr:ABC transporter permease [Streptosporangiaceae bacterium]
MEVTTMTTLALPRRWGIPGWGLCLLVALLAELTYFTLTTRYFGEGGASGMLALAEPFAPTGVLALGLAMVILTGSIDLSAGANASLAAVLVGAGLEKHYGAAECIVAAIVAATLVGLVNGLIVAFLRIDSLLVTLATQFIVVSTATSVAGASPPFGFSTAFQALGQGAIGGLPYDVLIFVGLGLATIVIVNYTTLGRSLVLIGYSQRAARYSGIATRGTLTMVFTLSGAFAGVSGVLLAAYYNSAQPDIGTILLLPAITIVVLGGVDIFGGRGRVGEVIIAGFLLGYLSQGMLIEGYSSLTITMVTGLVLIGALVLKISLERNSRQLLAARLQRLRTWHPSPPPPT